MKIQLLAEERRKGKLGKQCLRTPLRPSAIHFPSSASESDPYWSGISVGCGMKEKDHLY